MRPKKHDLHFLVDVELLPHAIVNIPNETKLKILNYIPYLKNISHKNCYRINHKNQILTLSEIPFKDEM
jgi:hypothetical protein